MTLLVEADTGRVAPQAPVAWAQALAQARQADVVLCAEEVAWFQRELAPRLPPSPRASQADWTQYGYDVIKRLRPGSELPLETCVFNAQTLADRHQVEACLRAAFKAARETPSEVLLIAPDPAVLWPAAQRVLATLPAAALQGSRLYVAASSAQQASVTRALSARGRRWWCSTRVRRCCPRPQRRTRCERVSMPARVATRWATAGLTRAWSPFSRSPPAADSARRVRRRTGQRQRSRPGWRGGSGRRWAARPGR